MNCTWSCTKILIVTGLLQQKCFIFLLQNKRGTAVEIIENSVCGSYEGSGLVARGVPRWELKDCLFVHEILSSSLKDKRCRIKMGVEIFPYSTRFKGAKSSVAVGSQNYMMCQKSDNGDSKLGTPRTLQTVTWLVSRN